jgi:hypothetical protein
VSILPEIKRPRQVPAVSGPILRLLAISVSLNHSSLLRIIWLFGPSCIPRSYCWPILPKWLILLLSTRVIRLTGVPGTSKLSHYRFAEIILLANAR